ncbi:MAG: hypothetical protein BWZ06_01427 [Bacteroidetes bacterium ADurb.BinA261]|nr:MAG: hypothetical protein BWZ06_01427 [Bacteroidetes bacterium ADurb.BinA261]
MKIHIHILLDNDVADATFLMNFHHIRIDIEILFGSKRANGFHLWKRLKSEFACESGKSIGHCLEWHTSVPQSPVVYIARFERFYFPPTRIVRRTVYVAACAVVLRQKIGYQGSEGFIVAFFPQLHCFRRISFVPAPITQSFFYFVVAAPKGEGGMIAQSFHVVNHFFAHILQKDIVGRVGRTSENEVLPNENAFFVGQPIKIIVFVSSASPHADEIHVG